MSNFQTNCADFKTIIVKNLPKTITNVDEYFRKNYGAIATRSYGRQRLILRYDSENLARTALYQIHQSVIDGKILSAEFLGNRKLIKPKEIEEEENCNDNTKLLPNYVKNLLAISSAHGFDKPPPPHLKYSYPKINRDILDSISISLMSNTKFYTQVLHLMNRMNLEPPFLPRKTKFILEPPAELKNVQTQTDIVKGLLSSGESELETEIDEDNIKKLNTKLTRKKRKYLEKSEDVKKKARKILNSTIHTKELHIINRQGENVGNIFEQNDKLLLDKKISMNVSKLKLPEKTENISETDDDKNYQILNERSKEIKGNISLQIDDLKLNRIPENQLKELPVYKNYIKGERTNKLYIKNLSKNVIELDLINIYKLFTTKSTNDDQQFGLDIKLMQQGRMKGQAFVTFLNISDNKMDFVEQALNETNGYILKNKPMIVCFGKK